jgi:endothelin-converting enzyme/putative endopeptidase
MKRISAYCIFLLSLVVVTLATDQYSSAQSKEEPALPYIPSLDVTSMDKSVDPCVDLYHYSCGGWQKTNPIPPDQTSWSVYGKLYQDNLMFLRGILEQAGPGAAGRDAVTQKIGDFYASCMDESTAEKRGVAAIQPQLDAIAGLNSARDMASLVARLPLPFGRTILFAAGSTQDPDNSEQEIADLDQGGLGLPDRDYYAKDDAKSKEILQRYVQHVQKIFELLGDSPAAAKQNAETILRMETALAKASWTQVERRDPYKLKNKMKLAELAQLASRWRIGRIICAFTWPISTPRFSLRVSCRRTTSSTASICAEPRRCSRGGSAAFSTPTTTWARRWDRFTCAGYSRRN